MPVSPEGWLIGLIDFEDAENGLLAEPPGCFTKTQFGPIDGHVALVGMLAALKLEFLPYLGTGMRIWCVSSSRPMTSPIGCRESRSVIMKTLISR
jgi:hypothetical protein